MNLKNAIKYMSILVLGTVVGTASASGLKGIGTAIDDTVITTKVKTAFAEESMLSPLDIHVKTRHGVVILRGKLDTVNQYERAIAITKKVDGVKDVDPKHLKWKSLV